MDHTEKDVIIVTVPETQTDSAIEDALSEPYSHGYFMAGLLPSRDGNLRTVFKRGVNYISPKERAEREAIDRADQATKEADDTKAMQLVRGYPHISLAQMVGLLAAKGVRRSQAWVSEQRAYLHYGGTS